MKNITLNPILPFIFYLIAIAVGLNFPINSRALSEVNCFAVDSCTQVYEQDEF